MNRTAKAAIAAFLTVAAVTAAQADDVAVGDLTISGAFTRATPPSAPVAGGFFTVANDGAGADRLVGGSVAFAARVEVHEMKMDGDVMKMRELEDGLPIPAGGEVVLKPGGYHIMFIELSEPLKEGDTHVVTLMFEQAGAVEVPFPVAGMGAGMAPGMHDHTGHGEQESKSMDHGG